MLLPICKNTKPKVIARLGLYHAGVLQESFPLNPTESELESLHTLVVLYLTSTLEVWATSNEASVTVDYSGCRDSANPLFQESLKIYVDAVQVYLASRERWLSCNFELRWMGREIQSQRKRLLDTATTEDKPAQSKAPFASKASLLSKIKYVLPSNFRTDTPIPYRITFGAHILNPSKASVTVKCVDVPVTSLLQWASNSGIPVNFDCLTGEDLKSLLEHFIGLNPSHVGEVKLKDNVTRYISCNHKIYDKTISYCIRAEYAFSTKASIPAQRAAIDTILDDIKGTLLTLNPIVGCCYYGDARSKL